MPFLSSFTTWAKTDGENIQNWPNEFEKRARKQNLVFDPDIVSVDLQRRISEIRRDRFKRGEPEIARAGQVALEYTKNIFKAKFSEFEKLLNEENAVAGYYRHKYAYIISKHHREDKSPSPDEHLPKRTSKESS